jgi:hypothetical protein
MIGLLYFMLGLAVGLAFMVMILVWAFKDWQERLRLALPELIEIWKAG